MRVWSAKSLFLRAQLSVLAKSKLDKLELESARASLVFEEIQSIATTGDVLWMSVLDGYRGLSKNSTREFIAEVSNAQPAEVLRVGRKYLRALFEPAQSLVSVVCPPAQVQDVEKCLKG